MINWQEIADYAQGTCHSTAAIASTFELSDADEADLQDKLLDYDLELCTQCGWWIETCEMAEDADEPTCLDCFAG